MAQKRKTAGKGDFQAKIINFIPLTAIFLKLIFRTVGINYFILLRVHHIHVSLH